MQNKLIIACTIFFLLVTFVFLSFGERKQQNINAQNLWVLYFENPKDPSMNFTIENHSADENFHWEILLDKTSVRNADIIVAKGESKTIPVSVNDLENKKITISVTHSGEKKEIYKNL